MAGARPRAIKKGGAPSQIRSGRSTEKHLLRRLAQHPFLVPGSEKIEAVTDQRDGVRVGVAVLHLKRAVTGPHEPLRTEAFAQRADDRRHVRVWSLLLSE